MDFDSLEEHINYCGIYYIININATNENKYMFHLLKDQELKSVKSAKNSFK
jgi:hypothetical protein